MLTLCIDTAYKYLTCALIEDEQILASVSFPCFKKQSEELFNVLEQVFSDAKLERNAIDSICISEGPGSYTGVRIAMSLAKTIGEVMPVDVYTISSLRLYAAGNPSTMVIMNARADRAYVGIFNNNEIISEDHVSLISEINPMSYKVKGDGSLVNHVDDFGDIPSAFLKTKPVWNKVDKIAYLVPKYLKESESYLK